MEIAEVKSVKVGILERGIRGFTILVSEKSEPESDEWFDSEEEAALTHSSRLSESESQIFSFTLFFAKRDDRKEGTDLTSYSCV